MSTALDLAGSVWPVVLERFERPAPAGVMARMVLEHALPAGWVDAVFEAHRQKQYARELLFSTVVELTTLVSLGCARPCTRRGRCRRCRSRLARCMTRSTIPSLASCAPWCAAAPSGLRR